MSRRWSASLTIAALSLGTLAAAAGPAAAAPAAPHPGTTTLTRPGGMTNGFRPGGLMIRAGTHTLSRGRFTEVESSNWSGYAQTGGNGAFSSVSASWTQPTATCPSRQDQYAAFWVGLDGYSSDSVEQTGTDSDCDGTSPDYYGWYEMYPANPVYYTNPVAPGDSISASVTFSGTETYTLVLTDHTQGWTQKQVINESGFDRSSAEVITEAPCCTNSGGILPLADFGTVSYTGATGNGTFTNSNATEIIMVDSRGRQEDSTSPITGSGDFSNTWIRSN
jgi:hypothetical protein